MRHLALLAVTAASFIPVCSGAILIDGFIAPVAPGQEVCVPSAACTSGVATSTLGGLAGTLDGTRTLMLVRDSGTDSTTGRANFTGLNRLLLSTDVGVTATLMAIWPVTSVPFIDLTESGANLGIFFEQGSDLGGFLTFDITTTTGLLSATIPLAIAFPPVATFLPFGAFVGPGSFTGVTEVKLTIAGVQSADATLRYITAATPEPSTFGLAFAGFAGMWAYRRRLAARR